MVIEYREYKMKLGNLHRFYQAQINRGFDGKMAPIMRDSLLGYFSSISGESENLIHLYSLKDLEHWRNIYNNIYEEPELQTYFESVRKLISTQENKFLIPAPIQSISPLFNEDNIWTRDNPPLCDIAEYPHMVIEQQTISLMPGGLSKYWEAYESCAINAVSPIEKNWIGCFYTLIGQLHEINNFWFFNDHYDRDRRQHAVTMNPKWTEFIDLIRPIVTSQKSHFFTPAPIKEMCPLFYINANA
jgi:hypothetical protein